MYKIIGADQKEYGPVSAEEMRRWIGEGRVNGQTLIQGAGQSDWRPLSSYPEFAAMLQPAATGIPQMGGVPAQKIPNYLVQAILVTLCCCLPAGIAAIVYSSQVNTKLAAGDVTGALAASKNAKMWCWISFGVGIPIVIIIFILNMIGALAGAGIGGR